MISKVYTIALLIVVLARSINIGYLCYNRYKYNKYIEIYSIKGYNYK